MKAKPIKVTRGNTTVKIYPVENEVKGVLYRQFVLTYKLGTRQGKNGKVLPLLVRRKFTDLEKAKLEAGIVASKLASGQAEVLNLTGPDRDAYLNACHELRPLNISLTHAVGQFVKASRMLPPNFSLIEAVEFFLRRNPANMPKKSVRDVVDEMIAAKTKAGRGDKHLADLQSRLGRFADAMQKPIIQVTSDQVVKHLDRIIKSWSTSWIPCASSTSRRWDWRRNRENSRSYSTTDSAQSVVASKLFAKVGC